jgi:hypothetical protein
MEYVLDVYKMPYDEDHPVVCMDESPKQLIEEVASTPMKQGQVARVDYEYIRHGMVNIFMANEPLKGKRLVEITNPLVFMVQAFIVLFKHFFLQFIPDTFLSMSQFLGKFI